MNAYTVVFNNQRSNFQNLISRLKEPFITTNVHSVLTDSIPMLNINSMLKLVILVSGFICVVFVAIHLVSLANSRITGLWIIKLPKQSRLLKQVNAIHSSLIQIEKSLLRDDLKNKIVRRNESKHLIIIQKNIFSHFFHYFFFGISSVNFGI